MAFNGSGSFSLVAGNPVVTGTTISSTWANNTLSDIASNGLSNVICKDGQTTVTANIPWGNFRLTSLGGATALTDAAQAAQVQNSAFNAIASVSGVTTIAGSVSPSPTLTEGQKFSFTAVGVNGASPTLNVSSTGALGIFWNGGTATASMWGTSNRIDVVYLSTSVSTSSSTGYHIVGHSGFTPLNMLRVRSAPIAVGRNISAKNNAGTPNTKIDVAFDAFVLKNAAGDTFLAMNGSLTVDFGATGANGLDAGSQASSTWYYIWVIAKPDGTVAGLGSTSSSAPTMPSGYTFKALVTAAKSDGSTHFVKYRQFGNEVFFEQAVSALNTSSYPTTETALDISIEIPPIAKSVKINTYGSVVASGGAVSTNLTLRVVTSVDLQVIYCKTSATAQTSAFSVVSDLPNIGQNIYYLWANVTNAAADAYKIDVLGFKLPGGGE